MSARSAQRTTASRGDRDGQEGKRDAQDDAACRGCLVIGVVGSGALAQNLRISTGLPDKEQLWDETARRLALANADHWEAGQLEVVKEAAKAKGAVFVPVGELPACRARRQVALATANASHW